MPKAVKKSRAQRTESHCLQCHTKLDVKTAKCCHACISHIFTNSYRKKQYGYCANCVERCRCGKYTCEMCGGVTKCADCGGRCCSNCSGDMTCSECITFEHCHDCMQYESDDEEQERPICLKCYRKSHDASQDSSEDSDVYETPSEDDEVGLSEEKTIAVGSDDDE
jgi:hypothetical protein